MQASIRRSWFVWKDMGSDEGMSAVTEGYGAIKNNLRRIEGSEVIVKDTRLYKGMEAVMEGSGAIKRDLER